METLYGRLFILSVIKGNNICSGLMLNSVNNIILIIEHITEVLTITTVYICIFDLIFLGEFGNW